MSSTPLALLGPPPARIFQFQALSNAKTSGIADKPNKRVEMTPLGLQVHKEYLHWGLKHIDGTNLGLFGAPGSLGQF